MFYGDSCPRTGDNGLGGHRCHATSRRGSTYLCRIGSDISVFQVGGEGFDFFDVVETGVGAEVADVETMQLLPHAAPPEPRHILGVETPLDRFVQIDRTQSVRQTVTQDLVVPVQSPHYLGMNLQELIHLLIVVAVLASVAAKLLVRASIPDRCPARQAFPSCFLFDLIFHPVPVQRLAPDP